MLVVTRFVVDGDGDGDGGIADGDMANGDVANGDVANGDVGDGDVADGGVGGGTGGGATAFVARAHAALEALAARPGYLRGRLARAYDEPVHWTIVTEWESVGAYRRALSSYEVKLHATPLLAESLDEPSAYEVLAEAVAGGELQLAVSDRAEGR